MLIIAVDVDVDAVVSGAVVVAVVDAVDGVVAAVDAVDADEVDDVDPLWRACTGSGHPRRVVPIRGPSRE